MVLADSERLQHVGDQGLGPPPFAEPLCHQEETISLLSHLMETVPIPGCPPLLKGLPSLAQQKSSLSQDYSISISLEYVQVKEKKVLLTQAKNWEKS